MQKKKDILFNDHWIYYHLLISGPTQNLRSYVGTNPKFLIVRAKPEFQEASQIHKFCKRPKHVVHLGFVETKTGQNTGLRCSSSTTNQRQEKKLGSQDGILLI